MRVLSHFQPASNRYYVNDSKSSESKASNLKRADHISDIFNHQVEERKGGSSRVHLSRIAQALAQELHARVKKFLSANKSIEQLVREVSLPESDLDRPLPNSDLNTRKLRHYYHWGILHPEEASSEHFQKIHAEGKDEEIEAIFQENEAKRQELLFQRANLLPNYYYDVFRETYSFN